MPTETLEWLKAVPTSLAGTVYEPWVQLLHFFVVVAVLVSVIAWILTRRHVIAFGQQLWLLLKRANRALEHACRYAPATERRLKRQAPYVALVTHGLLAAFCACAAMGFAIALPVFLLHTRWSWAMVTTLYLVGATCFGRLQLAAASWA
ncbi:MAG: hypothetical protein ACRERE_14930 [Candidatus Entotheonellia bacterium]